MLPAGAENDRAHRPRTRASADRGQPADRHALFGSDHVILEMPLKAAESVGKGNLGQRTFDAVTEMMVALFRAGAERL
jgi:hypothetical protein